MSPSARITLALGDVFRQTAMPHPADQLLPPRFSDPQDYARARSVLVRAGYDSVNLTRLLGRATTPSATALPLWLELTAAGRPVDQLVRLFLMGLPVDIPSARQALSPMPLESWQQAGLLRIHADQVRATLSLTPCEDLIIATDLNDPLHPQHSADHVMGVVPCSLLLSHLAIRKPVRCALDIGCGSGIQALLASRYAHSVTAIDRNPRALAFADFNAQLNGVTNVQWLQGDWLAPVAGQQFDLILCVPPYVISPESHLLYRDGGRPRDQLCQDLLREAARHLSEGGFCQMIVHCAHLADQPFEQRITSWIHGTHCDAWVIKFDTQTPMAYSATWCAADRPSARELLHQSQAWNDYFHREGIVAISSALITLRRGTGRKNWIAFKDPPEKILRPAGHALLAAIEAHDLLASVDDDGLLQLTLKRSDSLRLTQELAPSAAGWAPLSSRLSLSADWVYSCRTDPCVADLIARCDGQLTLAAILGQLALSLNTTPEKLIPATLPIVRELIEFDLLLPLDTTAPIDRPPRALSNAL